MVWFEGEFDVDFGVGVRVVVGMNLGFIPVGLGMRYQDDRSTSRSTRS